MCRLAATDEPGLCVCAVEVERGGLSYTVDTLRSIHATHPQAQLTFIVGADTASTLGSWREPAQLLELAQLAVATRDGTARQRVIDALDAAQTAAAVGDADGGSYASAGESVRFLEMPAIEVSSSAVRQRVAQGEADRSARRARGRRLHRRARSVSRLCAGRPMSSPSEPLLGDALLGAIVGFAEDKKAIDVVELDLRGVLGYTDYFLVCSGNTGRQAKAIHDGILEGLKHEHDTLPRKVEGSADGGWILMDYFDVVVHIFTPETREFYRLEHLWGEVPARVASDGT